MKLCARAGVRIVPFSPPGGSRYRVGDTTALASIKTLVKRRGPEHSEEILEALSNARLAPITADHIKAAEALCCEIEYAADFDPERLTATLEGLGARATAEAKALAAAKGLPMWRALAATLFKNRKGKPRVSEKPAEPGAPDRSHAARAQQRVALPFGEPEPGRSALDQRLPSLGL